MLLRIINIGVAIMNIGVAIGWSYVAYQVCSGAQLPASKDALLITASIFLAIHCVLLAIKSIDENF